MGVFLIFVLPLIVIVVINYIFIRLCILKKPANKDRVASLAIAFFVMIIELAILNESGLVNAYFNQIFSGVRFG